jgi:hypothetical protein
MLIVPRRHSRSRVYHHSRRPRITVKSRKRVHTNLVLAAVKHRREMPRQVFGPRSDSPSWAALFEPTAASLASGVRSLARNGVDARGLVRWTRLTIMESKNSFPG